MLARKSNLIEMMASGIPSDKWGVVVTGSNSSGISNQEFLDNLQDFLEIHGINPNVLMIAKKQQNFTETLEKDCSTNVYSSLNIGDDELRPPVVAIYGLNDVIYAANRGILKIQLEISRMKSTGYDVSLDSHYPFLFRQFNLDEAVLFGCSALRVNDDESGITIRMEQSECTVFIPYIPSVVDLNFAFYLRVKPGSVRPFTPYDVAVWSVRNRYGLDTLTLEEQGEVNGFKWKLTHKEDIGIYFFETSYPESVVSLSEELRKGLTLSSWYKQIIDKASLMAGVKLETVVSSTSSYGAGYAEFAVTHPYEVRNPNPLYEVGINGGYASPYFNWSQFANDRRGFIDVEPDLSISPYNKIQFRPEGTRLIGPLAWRLGVYIEDDYLEETTMYTGHRFVLRESLT